MSEKTRPRTSYTTTSTLSSVLIIDVGGYIIADNVLWSGKVLNNNQDSDTKALHDYNKYVNSLENVRSMLIPIRDGLMITQKIK